MNDNSKEVENPISDKSKKVERSAAYPAINLPDAIEFVGKIYKHFRNDATKRDDIIELIEGSHNRFLAAASYYHLLIREKDTYQVAPIFKKITTFIDEKERQIGLLYAFASPKLNTQLIEKFDGASLPETLTAHLSRFYGITEDAAPLAAKIFIENAKFCKVLDENNVLEYKKRVAFLNLNGTKIDATNNPPDENSTTVEEANFNSDVSTTGTNNIKNENVITVSKGTTLLIEEMVEEEKTKVRLTGNKFAYIVYPRSIKKIDVEILRKQLDVIELLAE